MSYTGIHCFLDMLHQYGITTIFGNPGTTELPLNDALLSDSRFRYLLGVHEIPVVSMADGFTQATGQVACVNLHTCCGLGNAMGMIYNAHQEGTPLLITAGQQDRRLRLEEPVLAGDLVEVARPWTKWSYEVQRVEDLPLALKRVVQTALTPPTGPVFLSLPLDIQMQECAPPDPVRMGLTVPSLGLADSIAAAAAVLAGVSRPAILAGSRVAENNGSIALAELAEQLGAPVYYESPTSQGRLPIAADHPLVAGPLPLWSPDIAQTLEPYDSIVAVGINLFRLYVYFPPDFPLSSQTRIVHIDCNVNELGKNTAPEVAVWGPLRESVKAVAQQLRVSRNDIQQSRAEHRRQQLCDQLAEERKAFQREFRAQGEKGDRLNSRGLMLEVVEWAPPQLAVVEEAVTSTHNALARFQVLQDPTGYFGHRGWALGWGAGFACGVQLAWPERPVLALLGDGSTLYGLQGLWTAVRHELPITFLICNNRQYQILKDGARLLELPNAVENRYLGMDLESPQPSFVDLARGFGMSACRVETRQELAEALRKTQPSRAPRLIEAIIGDDITAD